MDSFELIHPEDRERVMAEYGELAATPGGRRSVEFRYRHPDRSWVWTEARGRGLLETSAMGGSSSTPATSPSDSSANRR